MNTIPSTMKPALGSQPNPRMEYNGFKSRKIADGTYLLGGCFDTSFYGKNFHTHASAYLVKGENASMLIDTGHAKDGAAIETFIRSVVGDDLTYLFPTHEEYPHAGNLGSLLSAFPNSKVIGEVRNFHLYYPEHATPDRLIQLDIGDRVDLGGRSIEVLPAIIHDLPATFWAYDDLARIMYVSDAFAFSHSDDEECTLLSHELPQEPTVTDTRFVLDRALYWTRFAEKADLIEDMDLLLEKYPTAFVAPAHGNVVSNPSEFAELMAEALLATSQ